MSTIDGLGAPGPIRNTRTASGGKGGSFSVPADVPGSAASGSGVTPASASALGCLIALQEPGGETVQDRAARRRGRDVLQALADLQRAMLADTNAPDSLRSLTAAITDLPQPTDPRLGGVLQAIVLRARVELARRGL
jgi:hypothetical protein